MKALKIILGIIFFPITILILIWKSQKLSKKAKIIITAIWYVIMIISMISGKPHQKDTPSSSPSTKSDQSLNVLNTTTSETDKTIITEVTTIKTESEKHLYDEIEIKDAIGEDNKKHGEFVLIKADSKDCTESALEDVYFNFFKKHDYNWIALIYNDKDDNSGIYFNIAMIQVNAHFTVDDKDVYHVDAGEEPNQIIYTPNEDGSSFNKRVVSEEETDEETVIAEEETIEETDISVETTTESNNNSSTSDIEKQIKKYLSEYTGTTLDKLTLNDDYGTEEDGDYVALVYLTWDVKNTVKTSKEVLKLYSSDMAARIYTDVPSIQELCIFWTVSYHDSTAKISFERKSQGMVYTDEIYGF